MVEKLHISNEMAKFDAKDRTFFDSLDEKEKREFSPFTMIRWGSLVQGNQDLQEYYLLATNENLNKNFFDISATNHKKFLWLLATTVSPGVGKQYHKWLATKKRDSSGNKAEKFLREMYPHKRDDEIQLLAQLNDNDALKELAVQHGWTKEQIKKAL